MTKSEGTEERELMADEQVDIVDEQDNVIGTVTRAEMRERKLLHRGVAILCRNSKDAVYMHRRTDTKDVFPGLYDCFVGGMVTSGEDYDTAATREIREELGIDSHSVELVFKHHYAGADNPHICQFYEVLYDGPIVHQEAEIAWGSFIPPDELDKIIDDWEFVPDGRELWKRFRSEVASRG
jgi:isopentenyldiphosphate isomerase